jgi:transposase
LTVEQRGQLVDTLAKGAPAFGCIGEVWTTKRIAAIIKELFGVSYHPAHVSRLVRALGQSVQLPITQATQRDEAAMQTWRDERWPELKQRPRRKDAPSSG